MKKLILLSIALCFIFEAKSQCTWDLPGPVNSFNSSTYVMTIGGYDFIHGCGLIVDSLDLVGAFIDSANTGVLKCVGYIQYFGVSTGFTVWGNEPGSFYGAMPGDTMIWKVWDDSGNIDYFVTVFFYSSGFYFDVGGIHMIDSIYADIYPLVDVNSVIDMNVVTFNNYSISYLGNPVWYFGDGDSSTLVSPVHTYDSNGIYTINLILSNDCHTVDTSFSVKIEAFPEAYFEYSVSAKEVTFDNLSNYATNYEWDFGDANNSIEINPVYTFAEDGIYVVSLKAINSLSDSVYTDTIEIETSGIDEVGSFELIYPNPNKGKFQILFNKKYPFTKLFIIAKFSIFINRKLSPFKNFVKL